MKRSLWNRSTDMRYANPETRRNAFERLAKENASAVYGAALRMTRSPDDAQDLAQDTLVRAYSGFDSFTPGTNFRAWILRIQINLYITRYRRVHSKGISDDFSDLDSCNPADEGPQPDEAIFDSVLDEEIEQALNSLSEGLRLAVLLVDVESLTYEEAAQALGIPVGTVRSRLNRARLLLRARLAEYARSRSLVPAERIAR